MSTVFDNTNYTVGMAYVFIHDTTSTTGLKALDAQVASEYADDYGSTNYCVGNTMAVEIAPDITYLDHFISINGERRRDKSISTTKSISVNFTFDEINSTNIKRFLYGETAVAASPTFIVNASPTKEVSAQIVFNTSVGNDFIYKIPYAVLKTDGSLSFDPEDWMNANMVLDVLYDSEYTHNGTAAPYGYVDFSATSKYVD
ncbi:MAG: hypothetical protein GWN64_07430 [Candidatus Thorarchaeota archaeon]|nr:hypothetical protein [Candidatus Thorarchaeota archaeon]